MKKVLTYVIGCSGILVVCTTSAAPIAIAGAAAVANSVNVNSNTNANSNTNVNNNTNTNTNNNSNSNTNTNNNQSSVNNNNTTTVTITGPNGGLTGPTNSVIPMYNPTPWGNNPVANPCPPGYYPGYYAWDRFICVFGR